jgi:lysophospholipid acyltransferase (LPLAT)-like uncharacterized protein
VKRFLRRAWVQSTLAFALTVYVRLVTATMRWRFDQTETVATEMAKPEGGMLFFWHGRIALAVTCRGLISERTFRPMISLSPDGEFIAQAAAWLGFPPIRGSTARHPGQASKGGAGAFMEALDHVAAGGAVIITPDGPRGPREVMQAGPVMLARRAETRVFLAGIAARPAVTLNNWDQTRLPLPFSRGVAIFEGPLYAPAGADRAQAEAVRADWQARLRALDERARAMLDDARP